MSDETTTQTASNDEVQKNPELVKLEQAIEAEAVSKDSPTEDQQSEAPYGQAFKEIAEKKGFKSPDDLVKAYVNLESQSTKTSQEVKELRELAKEIRSAQTPQKQDDLYKDLPQEQRQALELLGKVIDERLESKLQPLKSNLEVQEAQKEMQSVKERFPGVSNADLEEAINYVDKNPSLPLEAAIKIVTYDNASKVQQASEKKTAKTQQKKRAYVESAKGSKTGDSIDYSSLTLEELENILPKDGQFIDSKGTLRR